MSRTRLLLALYAASCGGPSIDSGRSTPLVTGAETAPIVRAVQERMLRDARPFQKTDGGFAAAVPRSAASVTVTSAGATLHDRSGHASISLQPVMWGAPSALQALRPVAPARGACLTSSDDPSDCVRILVQPHGGIDAWWLALADGVELGFTIAEAPTDGDAVAIEMAMTGVAELHQYADGLRLTAEDASSWLLSDVVAWDADGQLVPVELDASSSVLSLTVDVTNARFPVTVDPVLSSASVDLYGATSGAAFGGEVDFLDDVNGDGLADLLVSAPFADSTTGSRGAAYIFHGATTGVSPAPDTTILSDASRDIIHFGQTGGDVNGDGYSDLVLEYTDSGGQVRMGVYLGASTGLDDVEDITFSPAINPEGDSVSDGAENLLAAGADYNGDGYDDIAYGDPSMASSFSSTSGGVYVHAGSSTGPAASPDQSWSAASGDRGLGFSVADAGDVNGDGYVDLVVVAHRSVYGNAYVHHGSATGLNTTPDATIAGTSSVEVWNEARGIGDVNGDGFDDVAILTSDMSTNTEMLSIYHGSASGLSTMPAVTLEPDPTGGGWYEYWFALAFESAGDLDQDGYDDLLVGTPHSEYVSLGAYSCGRAYIFNGSATGLDPVDVDMIEPEMPDYGILFGNGVAAGADVNEDGYLDVAIGAYSGLDSSLAQTGSAHVYLGYVDADGDGAILGGDPSTAQDCDDTDSTVGEPGLVYLDADGDGYGSSAFTVGCPGSGYVNNSDDCDDTDPAINPGADEVCGASGTDEDCDGLVDDDDPSVDASTFTSWYADTDNDDFGDPANTTSACEPPPGFVRDGSDCNDSDNAINPDATEVCDSASTDEDCDGLTEDADPSIDPTTQTSWYADSDSDGYGDPTSATLSCGTPSLHVTNDLDCDDTNPDVSPDGIEVCDPDDTDENCNALIDDADPELDTSSLLTWYADGDSDGYGDPASTTLACAQPSTYVDDNTDCDDTRADISPGSVEVCDALDEDEDCDGLSDNDDPSADVSTGSIWYADTDGDGWGDADNVVQACDLPAGYLTDDTDCDDTNPDISPDGIEVCDDEDADEDCDGLVNDEDDSLDLTTGEVWYADTDGDGFGDASNTTRACSAPDRHVADDTDCNDTRSDVYPGAVEVCDDRFEDEDCDGLLNDNDDSVDPDTKLTWYADTDGDGHGDPDNTVAACLVPDGFTDDAFDCDDTRADVSASGIEVCDDDGTDEDCDSLVNDDDDSLDPASRSVWYADTDGDGYGDAATTTESCTAPDDHVTDDTDCDDTDAGVNPDATEVDGDGIDQDCDGTDPAGGGSPPADKTGCATAGGAGSGAFFLPLVAFAGMALRRRRRAHPTA